MEFHANILIQQRGLKNISIVSRMYLGFELIFKISFRSGNYFVLQTLSHFASTRGW